MIAPTAARCSLGGNDSRLIADTVGGLAQFEFLYVNTVTGQLVITTPEKR